jgi:hypothetical protein
MLIYFVAGLLGIGMTWVLRLPAQAGLVALVPDRDPIPHYILGGIIGLTLFVGAGIVLLSAYVAALVTGLPYWEALGALALANFAGRLVQKQMSRRSKTPLDTIIAQFNAEHR